MKTVIFHIDVNSAFLSWSAVKRLQEDPGALDLRTVPSAVGGDVQARRGVITARSIPAKAFGVKTGEPVVKALQKCPQLILVRSDFAAYRAFSRAFMQILRRYTGRVEQVSIDEAFLDVTDLLEEEGPPETVPAADGRSALPEDAETRQRARAVCLAHEIKDTVRDELGFTVNVGIAENKLLAKTASDFTKPDRVHTLFPEEIETKFRPLPIGDLFGCGQATAGKLRNMGISTIGEAAEAPLELLQAVLGETGGSYIRESAAGHGSAYVETEEEDAKSYSNETTLPFDITASNYREEMPAVVESLARSVAGRMRKDGVFASTVTVSVKTDTFRRRSRQKALPASVNDEASIRRTAQRLLDELLLAPDGLFAQGFGIRLVGVGGSHLDRGEYRQIGMAEALQELEQAKRAAERNAARQERYERLHTMQEQIDRRFGSGVLQKGFGRPEGGGPETDPAPHGGG